MRKSYLRILPIWITLGLSTLAVLFVAKIVLNCIEAPTLPPIHCGMKISAAIAELPFYISTNYVWQTSLVLIAAVLGLRGTTRNWVCAALVPISILIIGVYLSERILKIDCHRKVYGNENGACY